MINGTRNKVIISKIGNKVVTKGIVGPRGANGAPGTVDTTLEQLFNVNVSGLSDGDVLSYNTSTGKWVNKQQEDLLDGGNF